MKLPKFLDCTLRDGGYINEWKFTRNFANALYHAVSEAGADYIEVGFFEPGNDQGLPWTNLNASDVLRLRREVPNGTKVAVMINYGAVALDAVPDRIDFPADLIRVATPKNKAKEGTEFAAALTAKGYETTINYMGVSNYTNSEILGLIDLVNDFKDRVAYFYVADSFGSLLPHRTREIFTTLRFGTDARLGFHPHNNLQLAFANCLEAIEAGVDIIDGSVFGMGRGAGNLFTDAVIAYFETLDPERFQVMPILQFADLYMEEMKQQYTWGYSLPQLLSGILKCHPNYPTNLLKEKSYTADDIFSMLRNLSDEAKPRYSSETTAKIKKKHFQVLADESQVLISDELKELCLSTNGKALLVCGGPSVIDEVDVIRTFIDTVAPSVFSVNNPEPPMDVHGVFFGNRRRVLRNGDKIDRTKHVIFGPEIHGSAAQNFGLEKVTRVNALKVLPVGESLFPTYLPSNSAMEAILGLVQCGYRDISICGLDGYHSGVNYYYAEDDQLTGQAEWEQENAIIQNELDIMTRLKEQIGFSLKLITKSQFTC
jgi:4-hydroxy 2-oxovalerate aldolase